MSEPDDLTLLLDRLGPGAATAPLRSAERIRARGTRRRRTATAGVLAGTLAAVTVLGLGTWHTLRPQSLPRPADGVPTVVPLPPRPDLGDQRPDGQADTRDASRELAAGDRLRLPDALLGTDQLPARRGVRWTSDPVRTGPQFWAGTMTDDHQHCWAVPLPAPVQEAARHHRLEEDATRPEVDEVLTLAASPAEARAALDSARRRCAAGATVPVFNPPPGSPPVTQFRNLNGVNGFVYTRDATSRDGIPDRPNCEYAVLVQHGALLVMIVLRQQTFSYELPRADTTAAALQALDHALAHTTAS